MPFKISLAEWSLHRTLNNKEIDHLDLAAIAENNFGIKAIEYVNSFFFNHAKDKAYLTEMKNRADDHGVKSLLIMCDNEGNLGDPDDTKRTDSIENHYKWAEAAKFLDCHSIRVNARSFGSYDEQIRLAADGLQRLVEFGDNIGINIIVENHGGLSSNGEWLSSVMKKVNHPRIGTLPDFGNFRIENEDWYDRYKGMKELMPFAKAVSAKSHEFDEDGDETGSDYYRIMDIVLENGYNGYVGIEYEGTKHSEMEGIRLTNNLLKKIQNSIS
jgi:sugar phosphate isomerase/epimerase